MKGMHWRSLGTLISRRNYYRPTIFVFFSVSLQRQLICEKEKRIQKNVVFFLRCATLTAFSWQKGVPIGTFVF